jgi:hypothetical protein
VFNLEFIQQFAEAVLPGLPLDSGHDIALVLALR